MNEKQKKWIPIGLSLLFIIAWQFFVIRPYVQKQKMSETAVVAAPAAPANLNAPPSAVTVNNASTPPAPVTAQSPRLLSPELRNASIKLTLTDKRRVEIFPNGMIGSASFEDYKTRDFKNQVHVNIIKEGFAWSATDPKVAQCLNNLHKTNESAEGRVTFTSENGKEKCELTYARDAVRPGIVSAKVFLSGFESSQGSLELRGVDDLGRGPEADHNYLAFKVDGSNSNVRGASNLQKSEIKSGKVDWLVWGDKYFASILIPKGQFNPNIFHGAVESEAKKAAFGFQYPLFLKSNETTNYEMEFYFGTRDETALGKINTALVDTVDLGFFRSVARLMLWALKVFNSFLHNYGLSIVALTILVRMLFWPLNKKVFASGQKMKALQPKIEQLKAKYGKDKSQAEQMNRELIGLYKTHKVNPLGSCLPLLLQMPIFLGLYGALNHSLDLYQAPFFGWITDLSSPDAYYVFPILWTTTLLAYMKLNPAQAQPGAPDMKWMMFGMNIFFGYLSKDWPAGLTLYLFVSNLVGITQQFLFQRATKLQPIQEGA